MWAPTPAHVPVPAPSRPASPPPNRSQELTLDENKLPYTPAVHASCFVLGIFLTFSGIGVLSTGPRRPVGLDESNLEMMAKVKANGEGIVAVSDQGETQLEFPPATPGAGLGTERGNNGSGSRGISFLSGSGLPLILSPLGTFSMSPAAELMPASIPIRADVRRASLPASFGGSPGVLLAAGTTIVGMAPLLRDDFFREMAVSIMGGLAFGSVLALVAVPVFYALLFSIGNSHKAA